MVISSSFYLRNIFVDSCLQLQREKVGLEGDNISDGCFGVFNLSEFDEEDVRQGF